MVMRDEFGEEESLYREALTALLGFSDDIEDKVSKLRGGRPDYVPADVLEAYLGLLSSEYGPSISALETVNRVREKAASLRDHERAHLDVIEAWGKGQFYRAQRLLDALLIQYPSDTLALFSGHQLDFFLADAQSLRDRVGGALYGWDKEDPAYGFLLGMFAFGLEESGWYERAKDVGLEALERSQKDVWALHAVVHTHEMRAEFGSGLALMSELEPHWTRGNFFTVHNYWHKCLYLLEMGDIASIFDIYDSVIHRPDSGLIALEMLDASAILWRLYLDGIDVGNRFTELSSRWAEWLDKPFYVFNDCHALMAFVGADRYDLAERRLGVLRESINSRDPDAANVVMTREVGLPVAESLVAFGRGEYRRVIDLLYPIRKIFYRFGGSHAQRDAFHRTLLEAAIRLPDFELATRLVDERIALKEDSPYNWLSKYKIVEGQGDHRGAEVLRGKARLLQGNN